jgi:hypothetical protein
MNISDQVNSGSGSKISYEYFDHSWGEIDDALIQVLPSIFEDEFSPNNNKPPQSSSSNFEQGEKPSDCNQSCSHDKEDLEMNKSLVSSQEISSNSSSSEFPPFIWRLYSESLLSDSNNECDTSNNNEITCIRNDDRNTDNKVMFDAADWREVLDSKRHHETTEHNGETDDSSTCGSFLGPYDEGTAEMRLQSMIISLTDPVGKVSC